MNFTTIDLPCTSEHCDSWALREREEKKVVQESFLCDIPASTCWAIKFNVETPKMWNFHTAWWCMHVHTYLKRRENFCTKINEQRHKHAPNMWTHGKTRMHLIALFLTLFSRSTFCVQKGITCSCRLQFFFFRKKNH